MPRILIIGATGYIGNALCLSLLRSGDHTVWGVARTQEKARSLAMQEVTPILCPDPINDGQAWHEIVHKHHIDVVVDASSAGPGVLEILKAVKRLGQERLDTAAKEGVQAQKLGFLYLCGIWVHGDSKIPVTDTMPVGTASALVPPNTLVLERPRWEQAILKAQDVLDVIIVRPSLLYGGTAWGWSAILYPILSAAQSASSAAQVPLKEDAAPGLIHLDDVASGMHAAIDKLPLIAGTGVYPIFDLTTSQENFKGIVDAAAQAIGFQGKVEYTGPGDNVYFQALTSSNNSDGARARQLLGWVPKRIGMLPRVEMFARAWMAANVDASKF
jgi:nucleoside-diphosphate-sugar epimerase